MDNLSLSAEERFEKFSKKYPDLIQKVPQKQIASYLGVTPEFFSKMKSKMLRKKNREIIFKATFIVTLLLLQSSIIANTFPHKNRSINVNI